MAKRLINACFAITATLTPLIGSTDMAECGESTCTIAKADWVQFVKFHKATLEWAQEHRQRDAESDRVNQILESRLAGCFEALQRQRSSWNR